jgi:membrane associated rhomboid family serine protease
MTIRRCPRCTFTLATLPVQGVTLDACPRCRGVFVDRAEAPQLFGPFGDLSTWQARGAAVPVGRGGLVCPGGSAGSHGRMYVWRIAVPGGASVEVDTCPSCSGLWLDAGEASRLTAGHLAVPPPAPEVRRRTSDLAPSNETPPAEEKASVGWYLLQLFTEVPVEVYSPKRPLPVVCLALLAACFAVFVVEVLAVTGADAQFVVHWGLVPRAVLHGEHPASLVTYMFLHGGIPHLVGNAWFLWTFGCNVESRVGRGRFLWLYLGSGVGGGLLHALLTLTPSLPLIGASGAIAGLNGGVPCALSARATLPGGPLPARQDARFSLHRLLGSHERRVWSRRARPAHAQQRHRVVVPRGWLCRRAPVGSAVRPRLS